MGRNDVFEQSSQNEQPPDHFQPSAGLTFEVPDVVVPLPSNGKVYDVDSALVNKQDIFISAMTTRQENILTNRSLAKQGTLISELIRSCLKDKSVNVRNMLTGDRNTILVALRISGYGAEYPVRVKCSACGEQYDHTFDLSELEVNRLKLEPVEANQNLFEFKLPASKAVVQFKFLTGADEENIAQTQAQKKKKNLSQGDLVTQGLMHSIVSINGESDRIKISKYINSLLAADSRALRKFVRENEPGMKMKGSIECMSCDNSEEVDIPLGPSFFWPDT